MALSCSFCSNEYPDVNPINKKNCFWGKFNCRVFSFESVRPQHVWLFFGTHLYTYITMALPCSPCHPMASLLKVRVSGFSQTLMNTQFKITVICKTAQSCVRGPAVFCCMLFFCVVMLFAVLSTKVTFDGVSYSI